MSRDIEILLIDDLLGLLRGIEVLVIDTLDILGVLWLRSVVAEVLVGVVVEVRVYLSLLDLK